MFVAHLFSWLFSFTKVPDVLLFILVGLLFGPILGVITPDFFGEAGTVFMLLILTVMLFEGGTELRLDVMKKSLRGTVVLVVVNFIVTMVVVGTAVMVFTDLAPIIAFMVGSIVGGTSSAIVIPLVEQLRLGQKAHSMLVVESAMSDVLSIVVTVGLLTAYEIGTFSFGAISFDIVSSFVGAVIIGVIGGLVWSLLLPGMRNVRNSIFTTPAFVFILFGLAEYIGFSGHISALVFGITIGNIVFLKLYLEKNHLLLRQVFRPSALSEHERAVFSEVVFLLQTFFFIYVGLSVRVSHPYVLVLGGVLVLVLFLLRIPIVRLSAPRSLPVSDVSAMAVIVPKGLAAAVLAALVVQQNVPGKEFVQDITYAVILCSIVITSLLVYLVYKTKVGLVYYRMMRGESFTLRK